MIIEKYKSIYINPKDIKIESHRSKEFSNFFYAKVIHIPTGYEYYTLCYTQLEAYNECIIQIEEMVKDRLIKIGQATEFAMRDGSKHTVFSYDIDYLLKFYDREKDEE